MIYNLENCATDQEDENGDDCRVIIGDENGWDLSQEEANFFFSKLKKDGCEMYRFECLTSISMNSFNLKPRKCQEKKDVYLIDIKKLPKNFTSPFENAIKLGINRYKLLQRKRKRGRHREINLLDKKPFSEDEKFINKREGGLKNINQPQRKLKNLHEIEQLLSNIKQQASTRSSENENSGLHIHANCVAKCDFLKVVEYLLSKINQKQDKRHYPVKGKGTTSKPNLQEEKRALHPKLFSLSLAQIKQLAKDFLEIDTDNDKNFQINIDSMPESIFFKVKDFVMDCGAKNIVDPNHKCFQEEIDQAFESKSNKKIQNDIQQFHISSPDRLPIFESDNSISESLSDSDEDSSSSQMSLSDFGKKIHCPNEEKENILMVEKVMTGGVLDDEIDNIDNDHIEMNCEEEDL